MPIYRAYDTSVTLRGSTLDMIDEANNICVAYAAQGYGLTLRQLYYQFVSRGLLPNTQKSYDNLGKAVNKGRYAGMIAWDHITDRTRNLRKLAHWDDPSDIIAGAAKQFRTDRWDRQATRVEVWVEKEALAEVIQKAAEAHDCAWFSCRGYVSSSELWAASQRHLDFLEAGQNVVVLHLGDHDPSGIDMTRDISDRLETFIFSDWARIHGCYDDVEDHLVAHLGGADPIEVRRIALNMDQITAYNPPPNPAKLTDSRATGYIRDFGYESWELDALPPPVLDKLIQDEIEGLKDPTIWAEDETAETTHKDLLLSASDRWTEVVDMLEA